jgi:hypothetical protein
VIFDQRICTIILIFVRTAQKLRCPLGQGEGGQQNGMGSVTGDVTALKSTIPILKYRFDSQSGNFRLTSR